MLKSVSDPVRQHYLPVSYLKGFCDPHELRRLKKHILYVYEKGREIRASTPEAEAYQKHLYTIPLPVDDRFEVEKYLSQVEGDAAPIILKAQSKEYQFSPADKNVLSKYIALMFTRTPALMEYERKHSGPAAEAILKRLAQDHPDAFSKEWYAHTKGDQDAPTVEEARKRILGGYYDQPEHPNTPLASLVYVADMTAKFIENFGWQVMHSNRHESFITSDFPVVGAQREGAKMRLGVGFSTPNSEFFFPLTSKTCLRMAADIQDGPGYLPPRGVRIVNQMEMRFAHRRIYAVSHSERIREHFDHWFGDVRIGENALVPMWEGKHIL